MGPFELSPSSGQFREVPERSTAGQQEADGTVAARQLEAHLSVAGRGILKPMLRPGRRGLLPGAVSPTRYPASAGLPRLSTDPMGHAQARPSIISDLLGAWQALQHGRRGHRNPGASGAVNRWLHPESVRHMSVTTATQRLTTPHHETRRDKTEKARKSGYPQLTGRFRRWWQVLGSNQRRLSRRLSGRPGESHPRAPTERNVTVSRHSALLILSSRTRAPGSSGRTVRALDR